MLASGCDTRPALNQHRVKVSSSTGLLGSVLHPGPLAKLSDLMLPSNARQRKRPESMKTHSDCPNLVLVLCQRLPRRHNTKTRLRRYQVHSAWLFNSVYFTRWGNHTACTRPVQVIKSFCVVQAWNSCLTIENILGDAFLMMFVQLL